MVEKADGENPYNAYLQSILKKKQSPKDNLASARPARGAKSLAKDREINFFKELKAFQVNNGYLLRMIEDGDNVILSDELRTKLYMTAEDANGAMDMETGQKDPTYGMTEN